MAQALKKGSEVDTLDRGTVLPVQLKACNMGFIANLLMLGSSCLLSAYLWDY
jgi:hypothetical protein